MAFVSDEVIANIRQSNDIVDVISEYIPLIPKGKNFFGVCPFHDDHSPSMSVSRDKQIYTCFTCKASGNVIGFVMDYEHVSYLEALRILGERVGIKLDVSSAPTTKKQEFKEEYEIYDTALKFYKNNLNTKYGEKAKEYLFKRGLNLETINTFDIGLSLNERDTLTKILQKKYKTDKIIKLGLSSVYGDSLYDLYKNRIMFPLKDLDGNTVGFSGRIYLNSDENKYLNSRESDIFKKSRLLYNFHNARDEIRKKKEIIICEGFMDVIRLYTIGIRNAVAIMGTSFTNEHLETIKKLRCSVTLSLDNDDPGQMATKTIGETLEEAGIETNVIIYDKYKDIDEYILNNGEEAFKKCYNNKIKFIDYKLESLKKNRNLSDSTELSIYINDAIKAINEIDDEILRELKIKELSSKYDINETIIRSKLTNKEEIKKNEIKKPLKITKKRYNKYQISELRIIYLMLNYPEVIRIYERKLGHLIDPIMRRLANEIVYFKDTNGGFVYADFVTYIMNKEELYNAYKEVISYEQIEEYSEEELEDYITTIQEGSYKKEVEKLKLKMKETLDINEKQKIATKIEKMKKEVLKW